MTNPCCCHNKVLLSRFNITGLGVMLFGHTRTHTRTHTPCSFYTCFLVSFPFHLIRLPSLLFNASASVVYSISAPCCSLRHCLPLCPPYFSHNFIFHPPPLLFLLLFLYFPSFPRSLWVATVIPLLSPCVPSPCLDPPVLFTSPSLPCLFQPCVHPSFLSLFPPPFPLLQVFLTSSPPPCISSIPRPSPILRSPHSCRAITVGMMGHNSPEPGLPRTCSH